VKIALLLEKLKPHSEIKTTEIILPDGTKAFIFSSVFPFPRASEPVWYVIVVRPGQEDIDDREIEAMLRHLWMYQLNFFSIDLAASADDPEEYKKPTTSNRSSLANTLWNRSRRFCSRRRSGRVRST